jgi:hypothetical protein
MLMDGLLQRYPDGEPEGEDTDWVVLEDMSPEAVRFNVDRLRAESRTHLEEALGRLEHADQLKEFARRKWPNSKCDREGGWLWTIG